MPLSPPLDRTLAETLGICAPARCRAAWYHLAPSGPECAAVLGPQHSAKNPSQGQMRPQSRSCCLVVKKGPFGRFTLRTAGEAGQGMFVVISLKCNLQL